MSEEYSETFYVANPSFDIRTQELQLTYPDGVHQFTTSLDDIVGFQKVTVQTAIIFGIQIGVTVILMLILALLTKPEKRRSVIFVLNQAALACLFIRAVLMCVQILGPFFNYYNFTIAYYPHVSGAQRVSVTCEVFGFLTTVAVELSMMFQVRVVCCTLRALWRNIVTVACVLMALLVCSFRFALLVLNANYKIMNLDTLTEEKFLIVSRYASLTNICTATSIVFFSFIFCSKLGHAIHHRRKMGMKQFGPMQIIFVMGCQTLFIPAIFGIVVYFALVSTQLSSIMPLVVATFLPLSSMWASANPSNINIAAIRKPLAHKPGFMPGGSTNSSDCSTEKEYLTTTFNSQGTLVNETREEASNPQKLGAHASARRDSIDLELAKMGHDIIVDRTYSVRNNSG